MRWGRGHFHDYDEPDPNNDPDGVRATIVDHRPELDHFHDVVHRGAIGVIRRWRGDPARAAAVLGARRLCEWDIANARSPEQRAVYAEQLARALSGD